MGLYHFYTNTILRSLVSVFLKTSMKTRLSVVVVILEIYITTLKMLLRFSIRNIKKVLTQLTPSPLKSLKGPSKSIIRYLSLKLGLT